MLLPAYAPPPPLITHVFQGCIPGNRAPEQQYRRLYSVCYRGNACAHSRLISGFTRAFFRSQIRRGQFGNTAPPIPRVLVYRLLP